MKSELPELARAHHHWIVLARLPTQPVAIALGVLLLLAVIWPWPWLIALVIWLGLGVFLRFREWQAELIILTKKRIVRMQGVPETTTSEASLRIERVAGIRLVQTVPGKLMDYGTIELEAPGDHPEVHELVKIQDPHTFYLQLRAVVFGDLPADPD